MSAHHGLRSSTLAEIWTQEGQVPSLPWAPQPEQLTQTLGERTPAECGPGSGREGRGEGVVLPPGTARGSCQPQPERVGVEKFVSVSRSFWKESQGAPGSLPSHVGTECENAPYRMAGQVAKGTGFTFPRGTPGWGGASLPLLALRSQSWPQGWDPGAAPLQSREGLPLEMCLPRLLVRHLLLPSLLLATWPVTPQPSGSLRALRTPSP